MRPTAPEVLRRQRARTAARPALLAAAVLMLPAAAPAKRVMLETPDQVIDVACQIRYTTTIVLPFSERILDFVTGDSGTWQVTGAANIAYVKPSVEDARSNVTLVTEAGRIYFFRVAESDAEPDIHVYVDIPAETEEQAAQLTPPHEPLFVSRDQVADYEAAAREANKRAREAWEQANTRIQGAVDDFRSSYPTLMRFEYKLERKATEAPFRVVAMWHDGRFTYARSLAEETPALYEHRDGQPSLVNYDLSPDGLFVVRRVLADGWFQLGKRRAEWSRVVTRQPAVGPAPPAAQPEDPLAPPPPPPDADAIAATP